MLNLEAWAQIDNVKASVMFAGKENPAPGTSQTFKTMYYESEETLLHILHHVARFCSFLNNYHKKELHGTSTMDPLAHVLSASASIPNGSHLLSGLFHYWSSCLCVDGESNGGWSKTFTPFTCVGDSGNSWPRASDCLRSIQLWLSQPFGKWTSEWEILFSQSLLSAKISFSNTNRYIF